MAPDSHGTRSRAVGGGRVRPHLSPWLLGYRDDGEQRRGRRMIRSLTRRLGKHISSLQRQFIEFGVCRHKLVGLIGRLVLDVREVNRFVRFLFPVWAALVAAVAATVAAVVEAAHSVAREH